MLPVPCQPRAHARVQRPPAPDAPHAAAAQPCQAPQCPGSTTEPPPLRQDGARQRLPRTPPHSPQPGPQHPMPQRLGGTGDPKPWLHVAAAGRAGAEPAAGNQLCLLDAPEPGPGAESRRQLPREPGHLAQAPVGPRCGAAPALLTRGCQCQPPGYRGAQHPPPSTGTPRSSSAGARQGVQHGLSAPPTPLPGWWHRHV